MEIDERKIRKRAVLLYGGVREYRAIILESDILHGSGDYEDPPEIADDQSIPCYHIWFQNLIDPGNYCAGGGEYPTLAEAMRKLESLVGFLRWEEPSVNSGLQ